jgi:hypothetical protein
MLIFFLFKKIDLEEDLSNFEFWLKRAEQQVDGLKFSNHWDNSQIVFNLNEHKVRYTGFFPFFSNHFADMVNFYFSVFKQTLNLMLVS